MTLIWCIMPKYIKIKAQKCPEMLYITLLCPEYTSIEPFLTSIEPVERLNRFNQKNRP